MKDLLNSSFIQYIVLPVIALFTVVMLLVIAVEHHKATPEYQRKHIEKIQEKVNNCRTHCVKYDATSFSMKGGFHSCICIWEE